ncbi:L-histidine N(alpha)-methyltransferase [Rhodoferax sp.]|uniref:L-histidine N(alpha)-methyltransferase n=1 Tax=Rhodoferax sp. TaxID=50421 RepID=UPI001A0AEE53|nr:L-histidine N(alpha)-methyltransferase [Rhodoferax sp.]MBE0472648.1 L-histidine N(alpha)-methyltransferase [Rhodoferax sp.]
MSPQAEIIHGLTQVAPSLSPKYFYDARGSALFEQITVLPEYYPTRVERGIMAGHGPDIARSVGTGSTVIELGAGNCDKARALCELLAPKRFVAVDISEAFLHEAVASMRPSFPDIAIQALVADLSADIVLPANLPLAQRLVFYPGSSIGNFDPRQALALLSRMRGLLGDDGALLIGVDLVKDASILHAAYNDAAGITAAFNLNALAHVNRLIGSDFDVAQWQHVAFFNPVASRIEMHLQASTDTLVRWPGGGRSFVRGERIHTENSYKYLAEDFLDLLRRAGLPNTQVWTDELAWFAVVLARP